MYIREWIKKGLCMDCKHKGICEKIQPGIVITECKTYERI